MVNDFEQKNIQTVEPIMPIKTTKNSERSPDVELREMSESERISYFMNHPEVIEAIKNFGESLYDREQGVNSALEYLAIFSTSEEVISYMKRLSKAYKHLDLKPYIHKIKAPLFLIAAINELGLGSQFVKNGSENFSSKISESDMDQASREHGMRKSYQTLFNFFVEKTDKYIFHGFNGAWEDQILNSGLQAEQRMWDLADIRQYVDIMKRNHHSLGVGFLEKDSRRICYSRGSTVYGYAYSSPEWFNQFLQGCGGHNGYEAFVRRDYNTARQLVADFFSQNKFPLEDQIEMINFFDKYWKLLATNDPPKCALIKKSALPGYFPEKDYYTFKHHCSIHIIDQRDFNYQAMIEFISQLINKQNQYNNQSTDENIPVDAIQIIDFPDYNKINC